jgi:hypothetical protein
VQKRPRTGASEQETSKDVKEAGRASITDATWGKKPVKVKVQPDPLYPSGLMEVPERHI